MTTPTRPATPRRRARTAILAAAGSACMVLAGTPASAETTRPETGRFPIEFHEAVFEPESSVCGFPIVAHFTGRGTYQMWVGAEGELLRGHVHLLMRGTLTANGKVVRFGRSVNQFAALDGTVTEVGLVFRDSAAGFGVVLMDRGRLVFDADGALVFEAGPHPQLHGEYGALCAALAP